MVVLFVVFSAWALAIGVGFALVGLWMILPFAVIQVLVVGLLCRWFYRHRDDCELVTVDADRVQVTKRQGAALTQCDFPRYWMRVRFDGARKQGERCKLFVGSHGKFVMLGAGINDTDCALVARELQQLLRSHASCP